MIKILPLLCLLAAGCASAPAPGGQASSAAGATAWTSPPAGSTVVADSMKVTDDSLNNFYFAVRLSVSDGYTGKPMESFKYDVHATYGNAVADGRIIMPYGGANLRPLLRRGEGYTFIMGFIPGADFGGDTAFHEYYRISGSMVHIDIAPLKGFTIQ